MAAFGGLAVVYFPDSAYRYRARVVAAVGVGLAAAVFVGAFGSQGWVAAALIAGAVAAIASFACQAFALPPPRELIPIMAALASTAVPADARDALFRAGLTAPAAQSPGW